MDITGNFKGENRLHFPKMYHIVQDLMCIWFSFSTTNKGMENLNVQLKKYWLFGLFKIFPLLGQPMMVLLLFNLISIKINFKGLKFKI